jgi:hypothetical protein
VSNTQTVPKNSVISRGVVSALERSEGSHVRYALGVGFRV